MLSEEFRFFVDNHDRLFGEYPDEYLVIMGGRVLHHGLDFRSALDWALGHGLKSGEFMVQLCSEGDKDYTQTFHSRARF